MSHIIYFRILFCNFHAVCNSSLFLIRALDFICDNEWNSACTCNAISPSITFYLGLRRQFFHVHEGQHLFQVDRVCLIRRQNVIYILPPIWQTLRECVSRQKDVVKSRILYKAWDHMSSLSLWNYFKFTLLNKPRKKKKDYDKFGSDERSRRNVRINATFSTSVRFVSFLWHFGASNTRNFMTRKSTGSLMKEA